MIGITTGRQESLFQTWSGMMPPIAVNCHGLSIMTVDMMT